MSRDNTTHTSMLGFTLVETVVIAPILILALGGFIVAMVTMVGDTLASRDANAMIYGTQEALNRIEQDARLATGFQATTGVLPSPQGQNSNYTGTAAFTASSSNHLIMAVPATTTSPLDADRKVVYYANQPNPCGATESYNTPVTATVIYYVYNNSLYRRTVMPTYTLTAGQPNTVCSAPWQQNSCSPGYTNTTVCKTQDAKIIDNVSSLALSYYSDPNSTTDLGATNAAAASTLGVTINTSKTSGSQPITNTASLRATRINSTIAATSVPLAFTTQPNDVNAVIADKNITFTVQAPYNPTYTWERSIDNGVSWSTIAGATGATYTLPSVTMSMTNYKYRAIALDQFGRTMTSNTATLTVSLWGSLAYQNTWGGYTGGNYGRGEYTKTSAGLVMLKGLVATGIASWDTTIATLPPEYRPSSRLIFYVGSYDPGAVGWSGFGRVDVLTNGEVHFMGGTNEWVSLDSIRFMASDTPCTTTATIPTPLANGWANYGGGYDPLMVCKDASGRISTRGLVRNGTYTSGTQIGAMPAGYQSLENLIVPAADNSGTTSVFGSVGIYSFSTGFVARGSLTSYLSVNNTFIANNGAVSWQTPALVNGGWVNFGSGFSTLQYGKTSDNVVTIKGLVKSGTTTANTVLFNLPSTYRPANRLLFSGVANNDHARIDVNTNGDVILVANAQSAWTSLDAISFYADGN